MNRKRIGLALLVALLAACQANQASSSGGSATPLGTITPSAPTPPRESTLPKVTLSPTLDTRGFGRDSMVRVATNDLRMRSEPGVQGSSVKLEPLLQSETYAIVLDGPVDASGFEWYRIHPIDDSGRLPVVGWVAVAGKDGEPWVEAHPLQCAPPPVDLFSQTAGEHPLACYGSQQHTFIARLGAYETGPCFELEFAWRTEPAWLDACARMLFLIDPATPLDDRAWSVPSYSPAFAVDFDPRELGPNGYLPKHWLRVSVTGQFDHPAAQTCRTVANAELDSPESKPDPAFVVFQCRASFAVTSLEVLPE